MTDKLTPVMEELQPVLDSFLKIHINQPLTDELKEILVHLLDAKLTDAGYTDRLIRVTEALPGEPTMIMVFTRNDNDKAENKITATTISIRDTIDGDI